MNSITAFLLPLFVFTLLWLPLPGAAGGIGNLKGFVYKRDGKTPRWGAQVLLKSVTTGKLYESNVTDAIGDYQLTDIPAGDYQVFILVKNKTHKIKKIDFLVKILEGKTTSISFAVKKKRGFFLIPLKFCEIVSIIAGIIAIVVAVK